MGAQAFQLYLLVSHASVSLLVSAKLAEAQQGDGLFCAFLFYFFAVF